MKANFKRKKFSAYLSTVGLIGPLRKHNFKKKKFFPLNTLCATPAYNFCLIAVKLERNRLLISLMAIKTMCRKCLESLIFRAGGSHRDNFIHDNIILPTN